MNSIFQENGFTLEGHSQDRIGDNLSLASPLIEEELQELLTLQRHLIFPMSEVRFVPPRMTTRLSITTAGSHLERSLRTKKVVGLKSDRLV
jgi:hypothetical protein